ncbi:MAG TPA: aminotransferase class I/II-fold pyridoxal phosphate-dependent enzyme, partial [Kofleriaceae bacterium]
MALANRVVVVTGGTRGIGLSIVRACVGAGAHVMSCARHAVAEPGVIVVEADVRAPAPVVEAALARWGRIDVWVNNAALAEGAFADVMAVNAEAALRCTELVLAACPAARIVNVSSGVAAVARAGAAAYGASKRALEAITETTAREFPRATIVAVEISGPDDVIAILDAMDAPVPTGRILVPSTAPLELENADLFANPLGPSPMARAALAEYAQRGAFERYEQPVELAKLLAGHHGVALDQIVLGAGAAELIDRVLGVVLRRGETLVAHTPSWPLFPSLCRARTLDAVTVPYRLLDHRVDHDLDAVLAAIDHTTRLVYLISPANPMGCALDAAPFARFLARLPGHVTVMVDEAYAEFITRDDAVVAPALPRRDPRVIVIRSFSKFYALAGLRIGYAIAAPRLAYTLRVAAPTFAVT